MPDRPYRAAQLAARRMLGDLQEEAARRVARALRAYAAELERALRLLPASPSLEESRRAALAAARTLDRELARAVGENRTVAFERVEAAWRQAQERVAALRGVPMATLGAVRVPPVTMLGAFSALGGSPWRTLIRVNAIQAGEEAARIMLLSLQSGVGQEELARRMRRYVTGAEGFLDLFEDVPTEIGTVAKIDLRKLPLDVRHATRGMVHSARRIAFSEPHNARAEAEVQSMARDPFVAAVHWTLSPVRSTTGWTPPDECDLLARADWYGLGPGVFPVNLVPRPPHPWDRCERVPVTRETARIADPKPDGVRPSRALADRFRVPQGGRITERHAERIREAAWEAVEFPMRAARSAA